MSTTSDAGQKPATQISSKSDAARIRQDKVSLMETDDYVCIEPSTTLAGRQLWTKRGDDIQTDARLGLL